MALLEIKNLLNQRKEPCAGIRISVRTRGCSGLSYMVEYAIIDKKENLEKIKNALNSKKFINLMKKYTWTFTYWQINLEKIRLKNS